MNEIAMKLTNALRLVLVLAPLAAAAQPAPPGGVPIDGARSADNGQWTAPARPAGIRELTLPQIHERLSLNPAQQELWHWFENRVDAYISTYYRQKSVLPSPEDPATHQVGRMVDNLQNRLAALEQVESATKTLYASLTPEQQKTANQLLILTIPNFAPLQLSPAAAEVRRKSGKGDGGRRPHRPGAAGIGPQHANQLSPS